MKNLWKEKYPPPLAYARFFLQKLDFKPLFYVYIKKRKFFAGFLKNLANSVTVLTDVWQRPSQKALKISDASHISRPLQRAGLYMTAVAVCNGRNLA